jgi:hypothetical protein
VTVLDWLLDSDPPVRAAEAIDRVASKRGRDGRWLLETQHPGRMLVDTDEREGRPSRWNTLRALRVLRWAERPQGCSTQ